MLAAAAGCTQNRVSDVETTTIGFILVGYRDDLGYNQAIWEGADAVVRAFPEVRVLRKENVPETTAATEAMEELIAEGATVLFATSFGHLPFAVEVADRHPEVVVVHQGGVEPSPDRPNLGTYWGSVYEPVYLAGIAAGSATRSDRLGYIVAFPIPATFANVNAFTLGARSINPRVRTVVEFTGAWCSPSAQRIAARRLLAAGVDVLTHHQDCTRTILEVAEEAGIASVGYHSDGSEAAPVGWLVGSAWNWGPMFVSIVRTVIQGRFVDSPFEGDHRGTYAGGDNPFVLTELGPRIGPQARRAIETAEQRFAAGGSPFAGPVIDRSGVIRVPAGEQPEVSEVDSMSYVVEGVRGAFPEPPG